MTDFRPACPRCGDLLPQAVDYRTGAGARFDRCPACGARTGLTVQKRLRAPRALLKPEQRPEQVTRTQYVVRDTGGFRITISIGRTPAGPSPGCELLVLRTHY